MNDHAVPENEAGGAPGTVRLQLFVAGDEPNSRRARVVGDLTNTDTVLSLLCIGSQTPPIDGGDVYYIPPWIAQVHLQSRDALHG